ncbi:uroporphyrinogen-III C-methyltransferase [Ferroplasma sp.]|uniref:uroporphyrinogen-III C-methyltransferase n=1 Tax=Ferroplasma sp. TaxID=2591003 RepID=UPI00262A3EE5|nr:uroporphyrinogen-III C-methyltransferase [Ferroplasma sp.]MCL4453083.1 uroporphyrinogen-III C-methyltransferase [Candidatus Thermoplasmatota archaeon]
MGKAYIVGCGPGNKNMLTVAGAKIITMADVLIYDHLINPEILDMAKPGCNKIYVGKKPYVKRISQEEINKLIVSESMKMNTVVRLKGGDPFLFGRGGEEIEELIKNNVEYEIIPGVSALISVPESAGIPLTHRNVNHGVIVTTGNNVENLSIPDCHNFRCSMYTLVIFMGAYNLKGIIEKLLLSGYSNDTPLAVIENGTYNHQKTFTGTLGNINYTYNGSPSIIVVGNVVDYHRDFQVIENRKYSGKIITVFYDFFAPSMEHLENRGFTVYKIRESQIFPENMDATYLSGRNIAIEGRYVETVFSEFKSSMLDFRKIGKIATDSTGKELLKSYGIFDVEDISEIDNTYIKLADGKSGSLQVARLEKSNFNGYIQDYIEKSDLIVLAGASNSIPEGIKISAEIPVIKVEYPYDRLDHKIMSFFGGDYEED